MGHLIRVQIESSLDWVTFWFGQYACHAKISNFLKNFRLSIVWFGSIRVPNPLSSEPSSNVRSDMGTGRSVWILGLGSVLLGLM